MKAQSNYEPVASAHELIEASINHIQVGSTISIRDTVAAVRQANPNLQETDCELVEIIVKQAMVHGQFVLFDLKEP